MSKWILFNTIAYIEEKPTENEQITLSISIQLFIWTSCFFNFASSIFDFKKRVES